MRPDARHTMAVRSYARMVVVRPRQRVFTGATQRVSRRPSPSEPSAATTTHAPAVKDPFSALDPDTEREIHARLPAEARGVAIDELLRRAGSVTVAELSERFHISPMTARRDLAGLERAGRARRTHAGTIVLTLTNQAFPGPQRRVAETTAHASLADAAIQLLAPGDSVFLDASPSAYAVARRIVHDGRVAQQAALEHDLRDPDQGQCKRLTEQLSNFDRRLERQLAAIEAGVEPSLVSQRIQALKAERQEIEISLTALTASEHQRGVVDINEACAVIDAIPNLNGAIKAADPDLRRRVYDAFRLSLRVDRDAGRVTLKALISSAFAGIKDLDDLLVAHKGIAGDRSALMGAQSIPLEWPANPR
jgi:DNA-binding Lrp family transcriptional regulator